ncbi:ISAs1 family transposase, partial [Streptomyces sp. JHD 1]|nr:ISAs1 family transposase [Streptomyces sp. JHD 1]
MVAFDALHSVTGRVHRLVQERNAHYFAVIKGHQPTALAQVMSLPSEQTPVAHTVCGRTRGRDRAAGAL